MLKISMKLNNLKPKFLSNTNPSINLQNKSIKWFISNCSIVSDRLKKKIKCIGISQKKVCIFRGKFAVVKKCKSKTTGKEYAAKIIKFEEDTAKFAIREYDLMVDPKFQHPGLVKLHEAYLVRKYLILIMEL